jgi:Mn-containing catalase
MRGNVTRLEVAAATSGSGIRRHAWLAAIAELQADGLEKFPVPSNFPQKKEHSEVAYQYLNFSDGKAAAEGSWASGPTPDGNGEFSYHDGPTTSAPMPPPTQPDPRLYGTDPKPNLMDKATATVKDIAGK